MLAANNNYIIYGNERIEFSCVPRNRVSSRIMIKVHPDCRVVVHVPAQTPADDVHDAVKKRARWIYTQLKGFRGQLEHTTLRRYCSGESHYYLGKQYMLKVITAPHDKQQVKLLQGRIEVQIREQSEQRVKRLLYDWYKERARAVFGRRLDAMLEQTLWISERPNIRLLAMRTQWGSCSPGGTLTLNPHLVKAPRECIDYVILHELCHVAEHNHSDRFYRLMSRIMPNWESVKERLDGMAGKLLNGVD
ncbi:MAG: SprT family zinc-dependent metalloprotease [Thermodesulfobacteriota bacterium]|nr:SprT family zinc-dependent metalloprotease [Thermodesulfobacteriota bacterium]